MTDAIFPPPASEQSAELSRWSYDQPAPRASKPIVPDWVKLEAFHYLTNAVAGLVDGLVHLHRDGPDEFDDYWCDYLVSCERLDGIARLEWAIRIANGGE